MEDRYDSTHDHGEFDFVNERRRPGRWKRFWRVVRRTLAVLLVILIALAILYRHQISAQFRAAVILTTTVDAPFAATGARWLTREPTLTDDEIAGTPVTIAKPAGSGPWPTMIFITGADPKGRKEENVTRLAEGLARAGILAVVPDLPGLADARVTDDTLDAGVRLVAATAERSTSEDDEVSIASVSTGASLALLIAEDERSRGKVDSITAIAPFADLKQALLLMTTGQYRQRDGTFRAYETDSYLKRAITQSLVENLQGYEPPELDELLDNTDPDRFDELYAALPAEVTDAIDALSPLARADALEDVHVEIATSTRDKYFPADESRALADALPDATLTVTDALDHAIPKLSADGLGDLAKLNGFLINAVRHTSD